jgi:hypothetical protein
VNSEEFQTTRVLLMLLVVFAHALAEAAAPGIWQLWFELVQALLSR